MLITERELAGSPIHGSILDRLEPLYEHEMTFPPSIVPVINNERHNLDLIQLESFLRYGKENDITDAGYAIAQVCQSNGISDNNIGFIVNEESLYEYDEVAETFRQLLEYNLPMFIAPISKNSIYYSKLHEAIILDEACVNIQESQNCINYCLQPLDESLGDTKKSISKKLASIQKEINLKKAELKQVMGESRVKIQQQITKLTDMASSLKSKLTNTFD